MKKEVFLEILNEIEILGERLRIEKEKEDSIIEEFNEESRRYFLGGISKQVIKSSIKKIKRDISKIEKEKKKIIKKALKKIEKMEKFFEEELDKNIIVRVSGIETKMKGGEKNGKKRK